MSGNTVVIFVLSLVFGILIFVVALLYSIFAMVRRVGAKQRASLESEGIVMDAGSVHVAIHFAGYSAPGIHVGVGVHKGPLVVVLTERRLAFLPSRRAYMRIDRADLARFTASVEDGVLRLHSDSPPNASGMIDFRVSVSDPDAWMRALVEAGAKAKS